LIPGQHSFLHHSGAWVFGARSEVYLPQSPVRIRPALELPELDRARKLQCLTEAVNATFQAVGRVPTSDAQEKLWDARVDALYLTLCLEAREALDRMKPRPWYTT
jgi:hypothetical protein